jgi:membrane protein YqaA with SNARE-associated domain
LTLQEAYFFLLIDSFMVSIILPMQESLAFVAMQVFGSYNSYLMILIASCGITLGMTANWLLGKAISTTLKLNNSSKLTTYNITNAKLTKFIEKNIYYFLLLVWVPILGSIISVFCGFLNSKLKLFLPIVMTATVLYHSFAIFY